MTQKKVFFFKRRWIVSKRLQIAIILYSVFLAVTVTIASTLFFEIAVSGRILHISDSHAYWLALAILFLVFGIMTTCGLILTNKIAGPIYRLKAHMEQVANSDSFSNQIAFRKHDFFSELIPPYNTIIAKLSDRQATNKESK